MDRNVFMEWRNKLYLSYELDPNGLPPKDLLKKLGMEFVIPRWKRRPGAEDLGSGQLRPIHITRNGSISEHV